MSLRFYPVYVNHIAKSVTASELRSLFGRFGPVIDVVIVDDYGFVNMETLEAAEMAIQEVNGRGLHSSLLHVDYSEDMKRTLQDQNKRFRCAPDPYTGVVGNKHPDYPQNLESPWIDSNDAFQALLGNKQYLDERLRIINAELDKLKENPYDTDDDRRGRSRSRSRRRSTSRGLEFKSRVRRSRSPGRQRSRSIGRQRSRSIGKQRSRSFDRQRSRSIGRKRPSVGKQRSRSIDRKRQSVGRQRSRSNGRRRSRSIGRQRSRSIGKRRSRSIGRQRSRSIGKRRSRSVGRPRSRSIGRRRSRSIGRSRDRISKSPFNQGRGQKGRVQESRDRERKDLGKETARDRKPKDGDKSRQDRGRRSTEERKKDIKSSGSSFKKENESSRRERSRENKHKDLTDRAKDQKTLKRGHDQRSRSRERRRSGDKDDMSKRKRQGSRSPARSRSKQRSRRNSAGRRDLSGSPGRRPPPSRVWSRSPDRDLRRGSPQRSAGFPDKFCREDEDLLIYREIARNTEDVRHDHDHGSRGYSPRRRDGRYSPVISRQISRQHSPPQVQSSGLGIDLDLGAIHHRKRGEQEPPPLGGSKPRKVRRSVSLEEIVPSPPSFKQAFDGRDLRDLLEPQARDLRNILDSNHPKPAPRYEPNEMPRTSKRKSLEADRAPVHQRLGFRNDKKGEVERVDDAPEIISEDELDLSSEEGDQEFQDTWKKRLKIKINIESKSMDDMTRKIRVEQELENQPDYLISLQGVSWDTVPSLPGLEVKMTDVTAENNVTNIKFKSSSIRDAETMYSFLKRISPIDSGISLQDNNSFYLGCGGDQVNLYLDRLSPANSKLVTQLDSEPMLLCRRHGCVEDVSMVDKKCRKITFSGISNENLTELITKISHLESGFTCVPFLLPTHKFGIEVYRTMLAKNQDAPLPHVITIEGISKEFSSLQRQAVKNKVLNTFNKRGRVKLTVDQFSDFDQDDRLTVMLVCTRSEAVNCCLEMTNTPVYGNVMYVSAKDSLVSEFKEEVKQKLKAKFGDFEDLHDDLVINCHKAEGDDEESRRGLKDFDFFVDGVNDSMDFDYFENLFNKYGMVTKVGHRVGQRYSFVTVFTSEDKALKAVEEVTGHEARDSTLVVQFKFSEDPAVVEKAKQIVKKKLALIRKQEKENADLEQQKQQADGNSKFYYFVGGIDKTLNKDQLAALFEPYGDVVKSSPYANKNFGFVEVFTTEERAIEAVIKLSGIAYCGNILKVSFRNIKVMERVNKKAREVAKQRLKETKDQMKNLTATSSNSYSTTSYSSAPHSSNAYPNTAYPSSDPYPTNPVMKMAEPEEDIFTRRQDVNIGDNKPILPDLTTAPPPIPAKVEIPALLKSLMTAPVGNTEDERFEYPEEKEQMYKHESDVNEIETSSYFTSGGQHETSSYSTSGVQQQGYSTKPQGVKSEADPPQGSLKSEWEAQASQPAAGGQEDQKPGAGLDSISWNKIAEAMSIMQKLPGTGPKGEGPKAVRRFHISRLSRITREYDVKELFSNYGQINRVDLLKHSSGFVQAYTTELMAIKCVCELNNLPFRGSVIAVDFAKASFEETHEFKSKWTEEIKYYLSEEHRKTLTDLGKPKKPEARISDIGSGLRNFDASLSLDAVHPSFKQSQSQDGGGYYSGSYSSSPSLNMFSAPPPSHYAPPGLGGPPAQPGLLPGVPGHSILHQQENRIGRQPDENYLYDIKGTIHSIQNKQILIEFSLHGRSEKLLAKLIPGHTYVNGKQNLGFAIKSNTYHMWPKNVKEFLQISKEVVVDLKRLTSKEMHDLKDKDRLIHWTVPFLKLPGVEVKQEDLIITESTQPSLITTGIITRLFHKWGIIEAKDQQILFKHTAVFWRTSQLSQDSSLSSVDLEVGDIVAVHVEELQDKKEFLSSVPYTEHYGEEAVKSAQLKAKLVWQVTAEVDPWVYCQAEEDEKIKFLSSSTTLNRHLPGEREAEQSNISGTIESINLPAGVIVVIDDEQLAKLAHLKPPASVPNFNKVYVHRSRIHINGAKILTDKCLDVELKPGDKVTMDIVRNKPYLEDPAYVMQPTYWVSVALRCNTVVRGVQIANKLKLENKNEELDAGIERARVVYLSPPVEDNGPAVTGTAVIDTGEYLGQRVEFDRSVCWAYSFSLARADLGHLMKKDEPVYVKLKAYNSYCVDRLWIGFPSGGRKEGAMDSQQLKLMKEDLENKGLTQSDFDHVMKGQYSARKFLPMRRQQLQGTVMSLHFKENVSTSLTIKLSNGTDLVKADREVVYIHGHWLGKADLAYCMDGELVYVELPPKYAQEDETASLVWIGERPEYRGIGVEPHQGYDNARRLQAWLSRMNMDMHSFRCLCEGSLPPKRSLNPVLKSSTSLPVGIDHDTLQQAALLQKMKSQMGKDKVLDLLKNFLDTNEEASTSSRQSADSGSSGKALAAAAGPVGIAGHGVGSVGQSAPSGITNTGVPPTFSSPGGVGGTGGSFRQGGPTGSVGQVGPGGFFNTPPPQVPSTATGHSTEPLAGATRPSTSSTAPAPGSWSAPPISGIQPLMAQAPPSLMGLPQTGNVQHPPASSQVAASSQVPGKTGGSVTTPVGAPGSAVASGYASYQAPPQVYSQPPPAASSASSLTSSTSQASHTTSQGAAVGNQPHRYNQYQQSYQQPNQQPYYSQQTQQQQYYPQQQQQQYYGTGGYQHGYGGQAGGQGGGGYGGRGQRGRGGQAQRGGGRGGGRGAYW